MKWALVFFLWLVSGFVLAAEGGRKGVVSSEAVAQVSDHVITSREVLISSVLDQASNETFNKKIPVDRSKWVLKVGSEEFQKHLAQVILEMVVQLEAENFSIAQLAAGDTKSYEQHVLEAVKGWEVWTQWEVSTAELEQLITRKLRAKNFLKFKTETSGVQVSDEEARAYYEKNRVKFGNAPLSQFKEGIKEVLAQGQLQEKLKDWFDILKRKYRVKFLGQAQ